MSTQSQHTILALVEDCCEYLYAERHLRPRTISGYREAMRFFAKQTGNPKVSDLTVAQFISFKAQMGRRGAGESRIGSIINAMKCLLAYSRDILQLPVLEPRSLKAPKPKRRQVLYLTPDEWEAFIGAIVLQNWDRTPRECGYCLRALVETLMATGMRISEALALDRNSIDHGARQASIIGKGGKQRKVFFTERALDWLGRYARLRKDSSRALFVSRGGTRLSADTAGSMFRRTRGRTDLEKKVTPHMLRHTTATNLLRNGCPIGYIKEILGHSDLMTTCRYYLGVLDEAETRRAHELYSNVERGVPGVSAQASGDVGSVPPAFSDMHPH